MVIEVASGPAAALRKEWGRNLKAMLREQQISQKELLRRLNEAGYQVSRQAVSQWVCGTTSPRPVLQAAIAKTLRMPPHLLFPVKEAS